MTNPSNSQVLRQKVALVLPEYFEAVEEMIFHPQLADLYPNFLVMMQWSTRSTVPLLRCALNRCRQMPDDVVATRLIPYFEEHIEEEADHDNWTLDDLEVLGVSREEVFTQMPSPTIASQMGAQYYWVQHYHPLTLLGDIAVREGHPPTQESIDIAIQNTGLPRKAFRTLAAHGELDIEHRADFEIFLNSLPLEDHHHEMLGVGALHTIRLGIAAVRELLSKEAMQVCSV